MTDAMSIEERVRGLLAGTKMTPPEIADRLMPNVDDALARVLARAYIEELAESLVRKNELSVRRVAVGLSPSVRPSERHGNRRQFNKGCRCDSCVRWVEWDDEMMARSRAEFASKFTGLLDDYKKHIKAEWTEELLASTFGTPDGRVTWADATVEQHRSHIDILTGQVEGMVRDGALHLIAIEAIESSALSCLREVVALEVAVQ